jgi:hypothetical protein
MVEYALLVVALVVGTAAAQKTLGPRVRAAANETSIALGGGAVSSGREAAKGGETGDERPTVTALPKVGSGPDATKEEMAAADTNGDGVLSTEEQAALARSKNQDEGGGIAGLANAVRGGAPPPNDPTAGLTEEQKKQLEAQAAAEKKQAATKLATKAAQKRHEIAMAILRNLP